MPKLKKAERLRRKFEKKKLQEHARVQREITYGRGTYALHEKKWKEMMMKVALPKVKADLMVAWHKFDQVIDYKDFTISLLMDEVDFAEQQHMLKVTHHIEDIDRIIKFFKDQSNDLLGMYRKHIASIRAEMREFENTFNTRSNEEETYLKVMLFGLDKIRKDNEKNVRGEMVTKLDDEVNRSREILATMSYHLELMFENHFTEILNFTSTYFNKTAFRRGQYTKLFIQDTETRAQNADRARKIVKMQETIKRMKLKFSEIQADRKQQILNLQLERQFFLDNYNDVVAMMHYVVRIANENVKRLVVTSNGIVKHLDKIENKGETILKFMQYCSKLQTTDECLNQLVMPEPCRLLEDEKGMTLEKNKGLDIFWNKVGTRDYARYKLLKERDFILKENARLRQEIKKYCKCIECPAAPPPLANKEKKGITVISGNDVMRNYSIASNAY